MLKPYSLFNPDLSNIRLRVLLLTLFTLIPFIISVFYINAIQLKRSKETKILQLKNITHLATLENKQTIEGVRQLLITLSVAPEIKKANKECSQYLNRLLQKYQRYSNFGIVNSTGNVICSAVEIKNPTNLSDRYFFQQTQASQDFTIGEYVISRATNQASINFGFPLPNNSGVVYATIGLDWLNKLISEFDTNENVTILVLDRGGTILARSPEPNNLVGKVFPDDPLVRSLTKGNGVIETSEIDGVARLYAYERIGDSDNGPFVIAGQPKSEILKGPLNDFKKSILLFIVISICSLVLGILLGNSLITKAVEKLEQLENLKRDFVSLASHQIRTPVTAIKWFTEILLSKSAGKLTKKQEAILKDTHLSASRMIELIGMLLNISKLESNKLSIDRSPTSIINLTNEVVRELKLSFKNKKIKAIINITKNVPDKINLDRKLIRHALFNLIHNAYKYSHTRGIIKIEIVKVKNNLVVYFYDQGIGIPMKERGNLFQKFSRASNAKYKDTEGVGLGLYLAKLIITAHKGKIGLIDQKEQGTSIYFTIPIS